MEETRYEVFASDDYPGQVTWEVSEFLDRLSHQQRDELARLDYSWSKSRGDEQAHLQQITSDWVEEHGGERRWWGLIRSRKVGV